jgi:hypothetical protein
MKTAIYIEDGVVQLVLTPQNEFEKDALGSFHERKLEARILSGSFYDCRDIWGATLGRIISVMPSMGYRRTGV